ncbi:MAG: rhodanese-like domain-containing protein [Chlamydiia bacterium]
MKTITLEQLKLYLEHKENPFRVIDVRTPQEHFEKRLKGSFNIPLDILEDQLIYFSENTPLIIHCAHGFRAKRAAQFLSEQGLKEVYYVKGDIENWEDCGLPVEYR